MGWARLKAYASSRAILEVPAVLAVVLVVAIRRVTSDDLTFYDEALYLRQGLDAVFPDFPSFAWGPTYSDIYWALGQVSGDPITIYFLGRIIAAVAFVLGVWLAARLLSTPSLAWVAAAVAAALPATYTWPGVSGPAAGMLIVALASMFRWSNPLAFGLGTGLIWLAAGSRPEFVWAAAACSVVAVVWLVVSQRASVASTLRRGGEVAGVIAGAIGVPVLLVLLHGSPLVGGDRSWVAFAQHFALRNQGVGEAGYSDFVEIAERYFPGAQTISGAAVTSPGVFLHHLITNLAEIPQRMAVEVFSLTTTSPFASSASATFMVATLLASVVVGFALDIRGAGRRAKEMATTLRAPRFRGPLAALILTVSTSLISVTLVYPRTHYLLFPAAILLVGVVVLIARIGSLRLRWVLPVGAVVLLFGLLTAQSLSQLLFVISRPPAIAQSARILTDSGSQWRVLGSTGLSTYVPNVTEVTDAIQPGETVDAYLDRTAVTAVLLHPDFDDAEWTKLVGFDELRSDPTQFGFTQVSPRSPLWVRTP